MSGTDWRTGLKEAATQIIPGNSMQRIALLVLLLVASVLRLWNLPHIPYTHDEISTLVRIYPSLGETIRTGVVALDVHPPGVQVFEWAWTRLFGMDEAVVKLPFIILSIVALFFLYRFAFAWAGGSVALVLVALLATLQYTVMYGQIARMYAFGFFTTALLADQLTRYLGSGSRRALIGFAVAAVLSAYTHHFAMMLAAFMAVTGLLLVVKDRRKEYLITCGIAALLYLPNIPILLGQLGQKGLSEWLPTPTEMWIPEYLWWIAHCSWAMAAVLGLLVLGSFALRIRYRGKKSPFMLICLAWGVLPLAMGYGYSIWQAPVLQYSGVLFSFPYLMLVLIGGLRHMRSSWAIPVAFLSAGVAIVTLITVRQHYKTFYHSRYEAITKGIVDAAAVPGRLALADTPDQAVQFYLRHWQVDPASAPYINLRGMSAAQLDSVLASTPASSVFLGITPGTLPERAAQVQMDFPFLLHRQDIVEGQTFLFGALPVGQAVDDHGWHSTITPEAVKGDGWTVDEALTLWQDTTIARSPRAWEFDGREFGVLLDKPVYEITGSGNDIIEARMDVAGIVGHGLKLVTELKMGDKTTFYRSQPFIARGKSGSCVSAIPLSDLPGHGQGQRLRVYVWNEGAGPSRVTSLDVRVRKGNPWLYGLFEPLRAPLAFP